MAIENELLEVALLSIGVAALATLIWFLQRNGMFLPIKPQKRSIGPVIVAYTTYVGPYDKTGPCLSRIEAIGKTQGIAEKAPGASDRHEIRAGETIGVYFDDPKTTKKEDLRALIGIVLDTGTGVREERRKRWENKLKDIPEIEAVVILQRTEAFVVDFPMYGMASILIGVWRVYPKLMKTLKNCEEVRRDSKLARLENGSLEFYSCEKYRTLFCAPIEDRETMLPFDRKKTQ